MQSEKERREKEIFRQKVETIKKEVDLLESHRLVFESNEDEFLHISPKQYEESGRRILQEVAELEREYDTEPQESNINRMLKDIDRHMAEIEMMLCEWSKELDEELYNLKIQYELDNILEVADGNAG